MTATKKAKAPRKPKTVAPSWKNRIVGHADVDPKTLKKHLLNWRQHPVHQSEALEESLDGIGWVGQIMINQRTGNMLDGHLRVERALKRKQASVPVVYVDLSEDEERMVLATFDPIGGLATANLSNLGALIAGLNVGTGALKDMLAGIMGGGNGAPIRIRPEADDVPDLGPPRARLGDLYLLGDHRLLCGDSTDKATADRVLAGDWCRIMVTDPPYGVNYDPEWREEAMLGRRASGKVQNDDRGEWKEAYQNFTGDVAYVWISHNFLAHTFFILEELDLICRNLIIWKKPHFTISRGHYNWSHESCQYAVRKGRTANWKGDKKAETVWEIANSSFVGGAHKDAENAPTGHGTQKPVELYLTAYRNHTEPGDMAFEPFSGSGTAIIAGELCGLAVRAIELDPVYVDCAVTRWENFTGQKAVLVAAGEALPA